MLDYIKVSPLLSPWPKQLGEGMKEENTFGYYFGVIRNNLFQDTFKKLK